MEGQWALAGHPVISLATEQLVDCDATIDPDKCDNYSHVIRDMGLFPRKGHVFQDFKYFEA